MPATGHGFAPPIFFGKENAPRPVEKKRFSFGFVAPASIGRYRSSAQLKSRLRLTNLVPAFYCKCLREVQQPPNCAPISGGPRSRPRPASLAPAGQFTFSRPTSKRQTSSTARVRQQGCDRQCISGDRRSPLPRTGQVRPSPAGLGNMDHQQDPLLCLLPLGLGVDARLPDQAQPPVETVQKQPHVL